MGPSIPHDAPAPRRRPDPWVLASVVAIVGAVLTMLYLDRSFTFWWDEWDFIRIPGLGTPQDWLTPHNEHWSTLPLLLYRATFVIVGLHSYLPYLAELLFLHGIAVGGVVALVRRDLWPAAALVAALPLLVLGSGYQDLMWAFQSGFVGSTAAGVWALYALDRPGRGSLLAGGVLLLVSLMCSGMGLFWLAAAALELAIDAPRRGRLLAVAPAVAAYGLWYLGFGASGLAHDQSPFTLRALQADVSYTARGVLTVVTSFTGIGRAAGGVVLLALYGYVAARLLLRSAPARAVGALGALVLMYATIGLVRADLGGPDRARYIYVAAFFVVLAMAGIIRQLHAENRFPAVARVVVVGFVLISVLVNVHAFLAGRDAFRSRAEDTRAFIAAAQQYQGATWVDPNAGWRLAPTVADVVDLVRRYGDPNADQLVPGVVPPLSANARDHALIHLMGHNFRAVAASTSSVLAPVVIASVNHADARIEGSCLAVTATASGGTIGVWVPGGGTVTLTADAAGAAMASIRRNDVPAKVNPIKVPLPAGGTTAIEVPNTGDGRWQVVVTLPTQQVRLCVTPAGG